MTVSYTHLDVYKRQNLLRSQEEKEAQYIATALEIYVTGSLNVFNHQSNVDINNRIVCYDIKAVSYTHLDVYKRQPATRWQTKPVNEAVSR